MLFFIRIAAMRFRHCHTRVFHFRCCRDYTFRFFIIFIRCFRHACQRCLMLLPRLKMRVTTRTTHTRHMSAKKEWRQERRRYSSSVQSARDRRQKRVMREQCA